LETAQCEVEEVEKQMTVEDFEEMVYFKWRIWMELR